MSMLRLPPTLRSLTLTSGLSPTPNRCISDFTNASSKFLAPFGTSDMSRMLSEISKWGVARIENYFKRLKKEG